MSASTLELSGEEALKTLQALASETRFRMLRLLARESLDITTLAGRLGMSEPSASSEAKVLEAAGLLQVSYERGKRGIRKICRLSKNRICVTIE